MRPFSLVAVLILAGMLAGCHGKAKMYSATAEMQVKPRGIADIPAFNIGTTDKPEDPDVFQAEIEIIQSPDILMSIIKNQGLDRIWAQRFGTGQAVMPIMEALHHLQKNLTIERRRYTSLFKVTARSEVPQEAADIANGVVDQYKAVRDTEEKQRIQRNKHNEDALRDEMAQGQKRIDQLNAQVKNLRQGGSPSSAGVTLTEMKAELEKENAILDALNIRVKQLEADLPLLESPIRIISRAVPPPE